MTLLKLPNRSHQLAVDRDGPEESTSPEGPEKWPRTRTVSFSRVSKATHAK